MPLSVAMFRLMNCAIVSDVEDRLVLLHLVAIGSLRVANRRS